MEKKVEVKKLKKNVKSTKILIFVLVVFSLYFVYTIYDQQLQINNYNSQIEMYNSEIASKKELTEYYKNQSQNIETVEYIEQVARDTLGYVKPYEKVFIDTNK